MQGKPKVAIYWAAGCGGCEIAFANLNERLLDVDAAFDLAFCPCLVDTKRAEVEAWADGELVVTLFNGAIRTTENVEMARLLRRKSQLFVAYGSCAHEGCIPGLANLSTREALLDAVYGGPTYAGGDRAATHTEAVGGPLELPALLDRIYPLGDVVEVDYILPGCPPESNRLWEVLALLASGAPLPPKGSVIGAGRSSVCQECALTRVDKRIAGLKRTIEVIPDGQRCLLEQGLVCMGVATRDGCGALCPKVNMPCIGCYGPPEGVHDQGAKMAATLGGILDVEPYKGLPEAEIRARIDAMLSAIPDYAGTFYKFSLADSLLGRARGGAQ